jgi:hypothetical protein
MKVYLDCPIFDSPTSAWGNALGEIELGFVPTAGQFADIPHGLPELTDLGFPSPMLVDRVHRDGDRIIILLSGVVVADRASAARIGKLFEQKLGFDVTEY